jgi:O-antigen/teichoic acid export membrane protein
MKTDIKSSFLMLIIANSANFFAFLYQFVMGRYLDLDSFGVLTAVSSLAVIITMFFGVMPYILIKYLIKYKSDLKYSLSIFVSIFYFSLALVVFIALIILIFQDSLAANINLSDNTPIYFMLAFIISGVMLNILLGALQGLEQYFDYAIGASLLQFTKLTLGVLYVAILGFSYNGALSAMVTSNILLMIIIYWKIKNQYSLFPKSISYLPKNLYRPIVSDAVPISMMLILFAIMTNIDMIAVKHFSHGNEAGEYAVASILSKIAIFLPSVLNSVLFPKVLSEDQQSKNSNNTFIIMVLITIFVEIIFCIFVGIFSKEIIVLLFGAKYANASSYLFELTMAMGFVATANVFFHFFVAKQYYAFLYYSYGVAFAFGVLFLYFSNLSILRIVDIMFVWSFLLLFANSLIYYIVFRKSVNKP